MTKNPIQNQFSKYANEYSNNNIIQQIVSKALVRDINNKPKRILELGCGSGQVFNHVNWQFNKYKAIDSSLSMCKLHPKPSKVEVCCFNFDEDDLYDSIKDEKYDLVISSSALQWSKDLDKIISRLKNISDELSCVLFTSNTFKTIQSITNATSPILRIKEIKEVFAKYYNCTFEVINYNLEFTNKKEMFNYIKNSGVSGEASLSYKKAKLLYKEYNLTYLEFEVIFIKAFSKS